MNTFKLFGAEFNVFQAGCLIRAMSLHGKDEIIAAFKAETARIAADLPIPPAKDRRPVPPPCNPNTGKPVQDAPAPTPEVQAPPTVAAEPTPVEPVKAPKRSKVAMAQADKPKSPKPVRAAKPVKADAKLGTCKGVKIVAIVAQSGNLRTVKLADGTQATQKQGKTGKWALARGASATATVKPVKPVDVIVKRWVDRTEGVEYILTRKADGTKVWETVAVQPGRKVG